ncbi:hypothetical protein MBCUT_06930 [Methanobrevibacter cuticularis]|uniref:Gene 25-like lysozyme n=1 Tax=Methanobrevibacter cuticularis TaxID=47311 RepID=A0A166EHD4_9EURY|nr:hypothetical protein [Methanobrevibacter cuticularis]KZX16655.1 hypothetical protein MBCUT_06930 [Methanobrevibacter cuticularis]
MEDIIDFGCDFDSSFELLSPGGHFKMVSGVENAKQIVVNRLTTIPDDLALFNYDHPHNDSYKYLASTDVTHAKALIKLATEEALVRLGIVEEIISLEVNYKPKSCYVDITLKLIDGTILDEDIELYEED